MGWPSYQPWGWAVNAGLNNSYPLCQQCCPNPSSAAPCLKCGGIDHWARNCLKNRAQFNLINLEEEDLNSEFTYTPRDTVQDLKTRINAMTAKEQGRLANKMGVGEDFPMAWLGQPWLSEVATQMCIYQLKNLWQYDSMFIWSQKGLNPLPF